ncbi:hypothetical protein NELLIE_12 [Arthrobacter phage Nellie]|uniref:Uncharacterized protein n=4 Tax=Jasminevirus adat TaxID=2560299 RepID=A0A249XN65_9CAUD|nr:hypothetical protein FDI47_gp12 [Arthrobacter phage Adat]ASZ72585.1 hypothetical protein ADAT_12 [Arthrobacter phage Adat]ASZ73167.1 hypothetical protein GURGLEFERB_12 [Arthrobacter phage GurgleFerb]ASZ73731.1 hypothetical protein NELLIE_12 [Arthrobacter phage Nellie]AXH43701.1 hypothetical protein SEA_BRAD_12 [Arthrobacter phage Brad]
MGDLLSQGFEANETNSLVRKSVLPENHHPSSRFTLHEAPFGWLAADIVHGTQDGPVFNLGTELDDRMGFAFIRVSDIEDMARVLGMATKDEVAKYKATIARLESQISILPKEVGKLQDGLDDLVNDFRGVLARHDPNNESLFSAIQDGSESDESDGGEKPAANVVPDKPEPANSGQVSKPSKRSRSAVIPADSSDESGSVSETGGKPGENEFGDVIDFDFGFNANPA